jgi:dTDP-4-dehydrorhamnose reductase
MTPDTFIIGGDSLIGQTLAGALTASGQAVCVTTRKQDTTGKGRLYLDLDLAPENWPELPKEGIWVLCAAVARLGKCAATPEGSRRINVGAMTALATAGVEAGAHVLFLSTDKVFDGTEACCGTADQRNPVTEYGRQKAEAEQNILALGDNVGVVRLTKVLDSGLALFKGWVESLGLGQPIQAYRDMTMAPVSLETVVHVLSQAAAKRMGGILQVSGPRDVSYEDAARHFARRLGADSVLVQATETPRDKDTPETPPRHTTMDTRRLAEEFGINISDAFDVLDDVYGLVKSDYKERQSEQLAERP